MTDTYAAKVYTVRWRPGFVSQAHGMSQLLRIIAAHETADADEKELTESERYLVRSAVNQRARESKTRSPNAVVRAATALVDSGTRDGMQFDALMAHLSQTVREYWEGGGV